MSSKPPENRTPSRRELLHDLEDIHTSLLSGKSLQRELPAEGTAAESQGSGDPNTPANTEIEDEDITLVDEDLAASPAPEDILPGQQSLFEDNNHLSDPESLQPNQAEAKGENPFLPSHIREKLNQNRSTMLENLANVGVTLAQQDALNHQKEQQEAESSSDIACLVDELVEKYLPMMEKELRIRLTQRLSEGED